MGHWDEQLMHHHHHLHQREKNNPSKLPPPPSASHRRRPPPDTVVGRSLQTSSNRSAEPCRHSSRMSRSVSHRSPVDSLRPDSIRVAPQPTRKSCRHSSRASRSTLRRFTPIRSASLCSRLASRIAPPQSALRARSDPPTTSAHVRSAPKVKPVPFFLSRHLPSSRAASPLLPQAEPIPAFPVKPPSPFEPPSFYRSFSHLSLGLAAWKAHFFLLLGLVEQISRVVPAWVSFGITTYLGLRSPTGCQSSMDIDMIRVIRRDPRSPIVLVFPLGSLQTRCRLLPTTLVLVTLRHGQLPHRLYQFSRKFHRDETPSSGWSRELRLGRAYALLALLHLFSSINKSTVRNSESADKLALSKNIAEVMVVEQVISYDLSYHQQLETSKTKELLKNENDPVQEIHI
uniref:Uncharacterized protein n=1 Tax=Cucumis melo TaxID=3656 RepID=A0A9I9EJI5_CUCME